MKSQDLKDRIRGIIPKVITNIKKGEDSVIEFEELLKFPKLKFALVDLLSNDYGSFVEGIDWVAPKPTTFRINLINNQFFYLTYNGRSWIAEVNGVKYYILNLPEQELATKSINNMLKIGAQDTSTPVDGEDEIDPDYNPENTPEEEPEVPET